MHFGFDDQNVLDLLVVLVGGSFALFCGHSQMFLLFTFLYRRCASVTLSSGWHPTLHVLNYTILIQVQHVCSTSTSQPSVWRLARPESAWS